MTTGVKYPGFWIFYLDIISRVGGPSLALRQPKEALNKDIVSGVKIQDAELHSLHTL